MSERLKKFGTSKSAFVGYVKKKTRRRVLIDSRGRYSVPFKAIEKAGFVVGENVFINNTGPYIIIERNVDKAGKGVNIQDGLRLRFYTKKYMDQFGFKDSEIKEIEIFCKPGVIRLKPKGGK